MKCSFVIGNGESRQGYDLESLKKHGFVYACNAIYREFRPDVLVMMDSRMYKEFCKTNYAGEVFFADRRNRKVVSRDGYHTYDRRKFSTGIMALWILCKRTHGRIERIFMLGFDYISQDGKLNNVFKDTENYGSSEDKAVNPHRWIRLTKEVFFEFKNIQFYRVMPDGWDHIEEFSSIPNFHEITYSEMLHFLEGGRHEKIAC